MKGFSPLRIGSERSTTIQLKSLLMQSITKLRTRKAKIASEGMVHAYQTVLAAQGAK
jgi:hypothetical protein